jgi:hypothetical protein
MMSPTTPTLAPTSVRMIVVMGARRRSSAYISTPPFCYSPDLLAIARGSFFGPLRVRLCLHLFDHLRKLTCHQSDVSHSVLRYLLEFFEVFCSGLSHKQKRAQFVKPHVY